MAKSTEQRLPKLYRKLQSDLLSAGWKVVNSAAGDEFLEFEDPSGKVRATLTFSEDLQDVYPNGVWRMFVPMRRRTIKLESELQRMPENKQQYIFFCSCYGNFCKAADKLSMYMEVV